MGLFNYMKLKLSGTLAEIRAMLRSLCGCQPQPPKPQPRPFLFVLTLGEDEKLKEPMEVTLSKPIKPGFRRPFTVKADEELDVRPDSNFVGVEVVEGDSTVTLTETNKTGASGFINGDGSLGRKVIRLVADGHIGDGDVAVTLDIIFEVAHPDATILGFTEGAADEPIPT